MKLFRLFRHLFSSIIILAIKKLIYPKRLRALFFFILWILLLALFSSSLCQLASVIWFIPSKWPINDRIVWDWTHWIPPIHQSFDSDDTSHLWSLYLAKHVLPPKDVTVLASVIWFIPSKWPINDRIVWDWTHWIPPIHQSFDSDDTSHLWSLYLAKHVLPPKDVTVLVFTSLSPFPNASHLRDPRFYVERKREKDLLIAALHGFVSRVIWIYPSWQRDSLFDFHVTIQMKVGITTIDLSKKRDAQSMLSNHLDYSDVSSLSTVDTICICPLSGGNCALPLFYSAEITIPPEACTKNATVVYEQVIDLLAESLLLKLSSHSSKEDSAHPSKGIYPGSLRGPVLPSTTQSPWFPVSHLPYKSLPIVVLIDSSYFGSVTIENAHPVKLDDEENLSKLGSSSAAVSRIVTQILHWLCQLDELKLRYVVSKRPCFVSDSDRLSSSLPLLGLCTRLSAFTAAPVHRVRSSESALVFSRLYAIFENLPIPRFIAMINDSATFSSGGTSDVTFFDELCDMFRRLY
ncbi:hypothetical protein AHF37_06493 [Paragonimus kellicotti]|nr:hypothetical protein AHF37_06493 [Paragonimus kellicotti]